MWAERKLLGAKYHLDRMKEMYLKNEEYFINELEAFLTKLRSVPDVLLEDFNQKFSLGISQKEYLSPKRFKEKAQRCQNNEALKFIKWWNNKMNRIRLSKFGKIFFEKRNLSIHRKVVRPDLKRIKTYKIIHIAPSVTVKMYDEKGNLIERRESTETPLKFKESKPPEVSWHFKEYSDEDVLEISNEMFNMVKKFIEEARAQFN